MYRLLDLFCGAGGAALGYHRAGFVVTGVDVNMQPHYPFEFIKADAMTYLAEHWNEYDVIHASPPCQRYSIAQNFTKNAHAHPDLIDITRSYLMMTPKPWVIENVVGAPLHNYIVLCGLSFGLKVRRHRLFESNILLMSKLCQCKGQDYFVIFGNEIRNRRHGIKAGRKNSIKDGRAAMGIDWMTRKELSQAIPPAYTEFIGNQLMARLTGVQE